MQSQTLERIPFVSSGQVSRKLEGFPSTCCMFIAACASSCAPQLYIYLSFPSVTGWGLSAHEHVNLHRKSKIVILSPKIGNFYARDTLLSASSELSLKVGTLARYPNAVLRDLDEQCTEAGNAH